MGEIHCSLVEQEMACYNNMSGLVFESKKKNREVCDELRFSNLMMNGIHGEALSLAREHDYGSAMHEHLDKPSFGTAQIASDRISLGEEIAGDPFTQPHNGTKEGSDSNSSCNQFQTNKRQKHLQEPTSARFKGVVLQQNGHWGAQIYANHQRIWLGTFKTERSAAMAYDSAAIKLRNGDSHRNFPWNPTTLQEPTFQSHHSVESVLNMLKDGSYEPKFSEFLKTKCSNPTNSTNQVLGLAVGLNQQLFQKELTPSDVGKLNRLVIPKKHAVRYFPCVYENGEEEEGKGLEDTHLVFLDEGLRSWKFRYCYWKSSQSFVFTRGWSRFVKEKGLKARDVVSFCRYRERGGEVFNMIKIDKDGGGGGGGGFGLRSGGFVELQLGFGCGSNGKRGILCGIRESGCGSDLEVLGNLGRGGCGSDFGGHKVFNIGRDGGCGLDFGGDKILSIGRDGGCGSDFGGPELLSIGRDGGCGSDFGIGGDGGCGSDFDLRRDGVCGSDFGGDKVLSNGRDGGCGSDFGGDEILSIGRDGGCGSVVVGDEGIVIGRDLMGEKKGVKLFGVVIS